MAVSTNAYATLNKWGLSPQCMKTLREWCGELYVYRRKKNYAAADELRAIIHDCGLSVRYNKDHVAIHYWDPINPVVFTKDKIRAGS